MGLGDRWWKWGDYPHNNIMSDLIKYIVFPLFKHSSLDLYLIGLDLARDKQTKR